ncbi:MAG TPA: Ig-like domain repeat protein, partial [Gemmataceae bacterium]|nr:Ig-like domain repeat protein [Gemmataceae bacterium]
MTLSSSGGSSITMFGGDGNDSLASSGSSDVTMIGGTGNTTLTASGGSSITMFGGDGNDSLNSSGGSSVSMIGGDGNMTLSSSGGSSITMFGGDGNDSLSSTGGSDVTMVGGSGNMTLSSSGGSSITMFGGDGNDSLNASGGSSVSMIGGNGNSTLSSSGGSSITMFGGDGNDSLNASGGSSVTMIGGSGNATLTASGGSSITMFGGSGNDSLASSGDADLLMIGGAGVDSLSTVHDVTATVLNGGPAGDLLSESDGSSVTLIGGGGNDTLVAVGGTAIGLDGLDGDNTFELTGTATDALSVSLNDLAAFGVSFPQDDSLTPGVNTLFFPGVVSIDIDLSNTSAGAAPIGTEQQGGQPQQVAPGLTVALTGAFSKVVASPTGNDYIKAGAGSVTLQGGGGNDTLVGGSGSTTILAGSGNDSLVAGSGSTTIRFVGGQFGDDTIDPPAGATAALDFSQFSGPVNLNLACRAAQTVSSGSANLTLTLPDPTEITTVVDSAFNDSITGNSAGDTFYVGSGSDTFVGGGGNDAFYFSGAGIGKDVISETAGSNSALNFYGLDAPVHLNLNTSTAQAIGGGSLTLTDPQDFSSVVGSHYSSNIVGNNAANESIIGGGGLDSLTAGGGNDYVQDYVSKVVYLQFPAAGQTPAGDHVYTTAEEQDILHGLQQIYAGFEESFDGVQAGYYFTLSQSTAQQVAQMTGGQYVTLSFDASVAGGGGEASELNTDNLSLSGTASINVGPFLGDSAYGLVTPTSANIVGLSTEIAAHELGHLSGLQHQDALGPIGSGVYSGIDPEEFYPALPGVTTTALSSTLSSDGKSITFTAAVSSDVSGAPTPTGTVNFIDETTGAVLVKNPVSLVDGSASVTLTTIPATGDVIAAVYSGDSVFAGGGADQTVAPNATITTLTAAPTEYQENVVFTAVISPNAGTGTPTGTVEFIDQTTGAVLGVVPLVDGTASSAPISAASLTGHTVVAVYSGDVKFAAGSANQVLSEGGSGAGSATPLDVMASPDAVGNTLAYSAGEFGSTYLGERDLIALAFNDTGTVLQQANLPTVPASSGVGTEFDISSAYNIGALPSLAVPNTLPSYAAGYGSPFDATAVAVNGALTSATAGVGDWYAFTGQAGQVMTFQVISNTDTLNPNPVAIPELVVVGADGQILGFNVHEFESADSTILDVTLPADGTYYIGVSSVVPTLTGAYQLFMYSFAASSQASSAGGDTLVGGGGNDTLVASTGDDVITFQQSAAGNATVVAGSGADLLDLTNAPQENVNYSPNITNVKRPTTFMTVTTNYSAPNPSTYGETVTFTATVTTNGYGDPTGLVDFFDQTTQTDLGKASLQVVNGVDEAVLTYSALSAESHNIVATYAGAGNYLGSSGDVTQGVNPAPITITASDQTQTYGFAGLGTTAFTITSGQLYGSDAISSVTLSTNDGLSTSRHYLATGDSPAAITPSAAVFSSGNAGNYVITYDNAPTGLIVNPATLTISGFMVNNKAYDATTAAVISSNGSLSGEVSGDVVSLTTGAATATFDNPNVGTTHIVTASGYALSGADSSGYALTQPTATNVTISAAPITITASDQTHTYGFGSLGTTAYTITSGKLYGSDAISSVTLSSNDGKSTSGNYKVTSSAATITPSAAVFSSGSAANYTITYANAPTGLIVNPATLTITGFTVSNKTYDGTTAATISSNGSLSRVVSGDSVSLNSSGATATFDNANAGTMHTVTTSGYALSGADAADYILTQPTATNVTISQDQTTTTASSTASGDSVTFSATVTANAPGGGTPTGTVDFYDVTTKTDLGKPTLSGGSATLTIGMLPGNQSITATYSGDSNFLTSSSTVTVSPAASLYVLNTTASGALTLSGNADVNVPGAVDVDSNSASAISGSGNAVVTAGGIQVVGGVSISGSAKLSPKPTTGANSVPDPLAGLAAPSVSGSSQGAINVGGNNSLTINPGIYSSITVSGNGKLTLNAGVYVVAGGGFSVSGNGVVTGAGVLIYNAGSNYPNSGGGFGSFTLSGNASVTLSAATTGTYAGLAIFQSRDNAKPMSLTGNNVTSINGSVYAPAAALTLSGNAQLQDALIVSTINLSGNTIFNDVTLTAPDGGVAYTPAQLRDAYGVNNVACDGTGQTIAIVDAYDNPDIYQALDQFDSQFGATETGPSLYAQYGPASSFLTVLNQNGQASPLPMTDPSGAGVANWESEEALDVEWIHAMAPGAQIVLVEADSQSLSDLMSSAATAADQPGVSVVSMSWGFTEGQEVLSADEAMYDADLTTPAGHTPVTFTASTGDYGAADPEYPAFSPNVVAIGGTSLYLNNDGSYNSETAWGYYSDAVGAFIGSGGGVSAFEPEPGYQTGVQSTGYRTTPDVSLVADPNTGAWISDPYNLPADNSWEVVGGTSLSAPSWAGLIALVDQGRVAAGASTLSSDGGATIQDALYNAPADAFHSITSGTNGTYTASAGYNLVTGLGAPVADGLIPSLIAYSGDSPLNATASSGGDNGSGGGGGANVIPVFNIVPLTGAGASRSPSLEGLADARTAAPAAISTATPTAAPAAVSTAPPAGGARFLTVSFADAAAVRQLTSDPIVVSPIYENAPVAVVAGPSPWRPTTRTTAALDAALAEWADGGAAADTVPASMDVVPTFDAAPDAFPDGGRKEDYLALRLYVDADAGRPDVKAAATAPAAGCNEVPLNAKSAPTPAAVGAASAAAVEAATEKGRKAWWLAPLFGWLSWPRSAAKEQDSDPRQRRRVGRQTHRKGS